MIATSPLVENENCNAVLFPHLDLVGDVKAATDESACHPARERAIHMYISPENWCRQVIPSGQ